MLSALVDETLNRVYYVSPARHTLAMINRRFRRPIGYLRGPSSEISPRVSGELGFRSGTGSAEGPAQRRAEARMDAFTQQFTLLPV